MPNKRKKNEARKAKEDGKESEKKFCFLRMPELRKQVFYIWIRRPRIVRSVNSFVLKKKKKNWLENRSTSFKTRFPAKFPGGGGGRDKHFSGWNNQIWPFTPVMQNSMTKIGKRQFLGFLRNIPHPGVQKRQISHPQKPIRVSHINLLR